MARSFARGSMRIGVTAKDSGVGNQRGRYGWLATPADLLVARQSTEEGHAEAEARLIRAFMDAEEPPFANLNAGRRLSGALARMLA